MRPFEKPPLAVDEQLQLLKDRGLVIRDDKRAAALLEVVSLFRLSPYMRPFQRAGNPAHSFIEGATLADIVTLYRFDRELRNLVMDALERVEVAVRACIGNTMAKRYDDSHWYLNRVHFKHHFDHAGFLDELKRKLERERANFAKEVKRIERSRASDSLKRQRIERRMRDNYFRYYGQTYDPPQASSLLGRVGRIEPRIDFPALPGHCPRRRPQADCQAFQPAAGSARLLAAYPDLCQELLCPPRPPVEQGTGNPAPIAQKPGLAVATGLYRPSTPGAATVRCTAHARSPHASHQPGQRMEGTPGAAVGKISLGSSHEHGVHRALESASCMDGEGAGMNSGSKTVRKET